MLSQGFFVVLGLLLVYVGVRESDVVNMIAGFLMIIITAERFYYGKTGKPIFGLPERFPKK